ncbi:MAG: hypothetical protein AB7F86_04120 [Bdellovibrionales bacterium]
MRFLILLTVVQIFLTSNSRADQDLPTDYRHQTLTVDHPLVLEYRFGPGARNVATLNIVNYPGMESDLFYFHMHINERAAKLAGEQRVQEKGGTFMYLHHYSGQRNMRVIVNGTPYKFDPNRIFTDKGLQTSLEPKPNRADLDEFRKFVVWVKRNILLALQNRRRPMVTALHNNTDDDTHGRLLSILTEKDLLQIDNQLVNQNTGWDIDDFFIATWPTTYQSLVDGHNPNISLRLAQPRNIGYLSNWMIEEGIEYLNIESETDQLPRALRMLDIVQATFQ